MAPNGDDETSVRGCRECHAPLAHDQRYCLHCGSRRGALPAYVAQAIGRAREQGDPVALGQAPSPDLASPDDGRFDDGRFDAWVRTPRAAAVAVLGMLGFGAVVGSLVGESAAAGTPQVIVEVSPHHGQLAQNSAAAAAGQGAAGASGGGVQTVTVGSTTPAGGSAPAAAAAPASSTPTTTTPASNGNLPPIKHVFLIALSGEGYNETFGHTGDDPYLAKKLVSEGELLFNYYAVAGGPLANEIALVSGQGPTPDTVNDCPRYTNLVPGNKGARGQFLGNGCVYPKATRTLAGELAAKKLDWKTYVQLKTTGSKAQQEACGHPKLGSSETDPTARNPYAAWRNPFLYFNSLNSRRSCAKHDAPLTQLATDLKSETTTPALSYVIADVCNDGASSPCGSSGMTAADAFLKSVVPEIKASSAYKTGGLIAITFDNAPQTGPNADPSSCCDNPTYPNLPVTQTPTTTTTTATTTTGTTTTTTTTTGTTTTGTGTTTTGTGTTTTGTTTTTATGTTTTSPTTTTPPNFGGGAINPTGGGGQVGLLLISPFVQPGTSDVVDYFNHFSLLASIDQLFGLKRVAYTGDPNLPVFGPGVWNNYTPGG